MHVTNFVAKIVTTSTFVSSAKHNGKKGNPYSIILHPTLNETRALIKEILELLTFVYVDKQVRVVRGFKNKQYGPKTGYRYDGIYKVVDFWITMGASGTGVSTFEKENHILFTLSPYCRL